MVITKNYVNEIFRTVVVLSALISMASAVDCNGKSFRCVNSTHFMICVDLGGGVSQAIDDFFIACPPPTVCQGTNQFECEFPAPTTPSTTLTKVISETTLPWEEVVTASSPGNASKEFSENYLNTERITTTVEYNVNTDAAVDFTTATSSDLYVNNELNTPDSAVEITTAAETTPTVNENLNIIEYVPTVEAADITTTAVETITQTPTENKNLTEMEPAIVEETTTLISKTANATKTENVVQDILPVDRIADDFTKIPPFGHKFQKSEAVNVSHVFEESVRPNENIEVYKKPANNKIGNKETQTPTINNPVVPDSSATSINSTTSHEANENIKYTITNKSLQEKDYTTVTNVPTDRNPAETTILYGIWTETVENVKSTDQPTTINEESIITDTTQNVVTENIINPTRQAVNVEMITTDVVPTIVSNAQPMTTTFEDNMKIETPSHATENILSIVNNGASTNGVVRVQPVNMDTITTEAMDKPTTISNFQSMPSTIEDNMKIVTQSPVTENVISTVNNGPSTNDFVTVQSVNMDTTTTEAMDKPTTISNVQSIPSTIEDNMKIETQSPVTENVVSTVNYGPSTNDFVTVQSMNMDTITTEAMDKPTTISNVQSMQSTIEDNMKIETQPLVTENIVSTVNNGPSTNDFATVQSVNMDTITTEAMDKLTTISNVQSMPSTIEDNMKIETQSPVTENIISTVNNGPSTNDFVTVQSVNMDTITTEAMDKPTTNSNVQSMPSTIEDNMKIETQSPVAENVVSTVNYGPSTNDFVTVQSVNIDTITTEAMDKPTTISNVQSMPSTIEDNMKIETQSPVTENIISTVNNGPSTNDFVTVQSVKTDTITTEAMDKLTTISNVQSMQSTIEDNMKIESQWAVTENIVSTVNNGPSTNDFATVQSVNMDTITTEAMDKPTTNSNVQSMQSTIEDNMKIETQSPVTENVVSTVNNEPSTNDLVIVQSVNMDKITTEAMDKPTTISNVKSIPSTIEDNMKIETQLPVTENIASTVNNGASTNDLVTVQSVNMDTITTEAMDKPTTISNVQSMPSTIEDNMKIETQSLVTENIVSTVNNGASINDFVTVQSVNMDTITTEAMDKPTTISNVQSMQSTIEDNIKIETQSPVTENIVSTVNNEPSTNDFVTVQSVNMDTITTEAKDKPTIISNVQSMQSTIEDNMKIETQSPVTENIVSTVNNEPSTNDFVTVQSVNMDTITTEAMDKPTKISNVQLMQPTIEDNMKIETQSPVTENIVSTVNNVATTNSVVTVQSVDMDTITTEAMYIPTTVSNAQPVSLGFEDNMKTERPLDNENIVSTVNNEVDTNDFMTVQGLDPDIINTDAMYTPTTVSNGRSPSFEDNVNPVNDGASTNEFMTAQLLSVDKIEAMYNPISNALPMASAYEDNMTKDVPIIKNILSSVNNETSTNSFMPSLPVNVDVINTEAIHIPTTTTNTYNIVQPMPPTFESSNRKDVLLPESADILSSVNNGVSTNGLKAPQPENLDIVNTDAMYIQTTAIPPMATALEDSKTIEASLSATKKIISALNNEDNTNGFMVAKATDLGHIIQKAEFETAVQLTTDTVPLTNVMELSFNNEKTAFDISNQNLIRQQGESKTKQAMNNLQPIIVENNVIWNPLANQLLDKSNPNSESVGTSSVTNINAKVNDRIAATLNTKLASQQTTTSSVITGSPTYANINDRVQSIDYIKAERSSGSTVVVLEKSLRKSGNNTEIYTDNLEDIDAKSNQNPSVVSISITSDNKPELKSSDIMGGYIISPIVAHNTQINLPTNSDGSTEKNRVGTPMDKKNVNEEDDTLSKPEMLDVLSLPISIHYNAPITNIPILKDLTSNNQAENTVIVTTSHIATVSTIEGTSFDTQTSDLVTKNGDATFKSQTQSIEGSDLLSQPSQHVEKVPNKKASAPNNEYVIAESKPSGTSTNTDNPYNIHSQNFTNNVKTGIITSESVSESNYESHKPENITHTVSHVNNNHNEQVPTVAAPTYSCINGIRGRYSDKNDCKKFYICFGNSEPIVGHCPENTVFSDLKKLCTRNMSHCIRENQFKCPSVGRFSDFMKDDIYYICVNHNSKLYRLKFQCQKGYILDKTTVKCIETKEIESNESVSISSSDNSSQTSSSDISSSASSKSISSSSTSNSSRVDVSSSKDTNSPKSKKRNKAPEATDKYEGKEDEEDDEVFICKKEGKFPIPNECRRYYLCKNRKKEYRRKIKKCDSGKVFHKSKKKCVDDDSYEC